jgi:hypothetical protein
MARKDLNKKIETAVVETSKLVNKLNELKAAGTKGTAEFIKLAEEAQKQLATLSKLSTAIKNSFSQTGNVKQFNEDVKKVGQNITKVTKVQKDSTKVVEDAEKKSLQRRERIQKAWDSRKAKRLQEEERKKKKADQDEETRRKRVLSNIEKEEIRKFKARVQRLKQEQKEQEAAEKRRDFGGGFRAQFTGRALGGALGSLTKFLGIYKLLAFAGDAFNKVIVDSVKISIDFEKELANLGAVAGATSEEVSQLRDAALDVAGSTTFTASEIVQMQVALSKLGFEAGQVVTATRSIAFAAQALGENLDKTATLIGKVINQFGLLAEETNLVADTLVTTINNSALSLESFGTAIQYVGPLASELGFGFQETAAAMAVLADNGFTASRVGTGLRGIFTELGKTSADVKKEIEELAARNLSLAEAVELVGKRNAAQLLTLTRNIELLKEGNTQYSEQGRAIESAAKQIDTVSGQLQLLSSRYNEVQVNIGNAIIQTKAFESVLNFLSPRVAETVAGFKAFREVGTGNFNQGVEAVADGAEASFIAIDQLSKVAGPLQDDFERLAYQVKAGGVAFDEYGNVVARQDILDTLDPDTIKTWSGYVQLLEDAKKTEIERRTAAEGRSTIDSIFKDEVEALNQAQKEGIDITAKANAEAEKAQVLLDGYNATLRDRKVLTNEERIEIEAMQSQTQLYINKLSNLLGVQKNLNDANKKDFEQRKFSLRDYEQQLDNLDAEYDKLKKLNELKGDEVSTGSALLIINKSKVDIYDEMIGRLNATKTSIEGEIKATDQSTDAGRKKVKVHKKEIEQLDKLIEKYKEKKGALSEDLGVMEQIFAQGEKDLKQAQQIDAGESGGVFARFKKGAIKAAGEAKIEAQTQIINRLSAQLLEAAGDDPILKQIAEEYIKGLKVELGATAGEIEWGEVLAELNKALSAAVQDYNETSLQNKKAYLNQELDAIKDKYQVEEDILKASLNNQLITESQYRVKQQELRKKQLIEEDNIKRQIFEQEKKSDLRNTTIETLEALASNALNNFERYDTISAGINTTIGYGIILGAGAAKADAIRRREYVGAKFEDGGIVEGPSHAQGGIPFSVQGQGGYEMEGGEFIVNKKASSLHRQLLESINNSVKPNSAIQPMKFATGGIVTNNVSNVTGTAKESVDYLKAIADATTSTAIQSSKPVRAFVTERDLRTSDTERKLRDRNSRL